jgi:hypothetical protein
MTLLRRLTLATPSPRHRAGVDLTPLRREHSRVERRTIPANQERALPNVSGDSLKTAATFEPGDAPVLGLNMPRSREREEIPRIRFFRYHGFRNRDNGARAIAISIDSSPASLQPDVRSRPAESCPCNWLQTNRSSCASLSTVAWWRSSSTGAGAGRPRVFPGGQGSVAASLRSRVRVGRSLDAWRIASTYR